MWKSGISPRGAMIFYQQADVERYRVFNRGCGSKEKIKMLHRLSIHNPQRFVEKAAMIYRQELILAVISRMLFCRLVSPSFRPTSTLRMAYSTVE